MSEARRFCENCGRGIGETTRFCPNCGADQNSTSEAPTGPSPTAPQPGSISTPDVPGIPPPPNSSQQQNRGCLARIGRTAIIIVVILVILGIIGAIISGGGSGDKTTSTDSDAKEEKKKESAKEESKKDKEKAAAVSIGQPVTAGDIEWTVTNARQTDQLSQESLGQFGETKQGNFIVVDVRFTNNGTEPSTLSPQSLSLFDSSDRESRPDPESFGYVPNERNIFLEQVNPGVAKEGTVIFTVAPDASGFRLRVGDAALFSNSEAFVDLGF